MSHYSNSSSMKHGPEGREREVNGSGWVRRQVKGQTENGKGQSGNLGSGRVDTLVKLEGWKVRMGGRREGKRVKNLEWVNNENDNRK